MSATIEIPAVARREHEIVPGAPEVRTHGSGAKQMPFALAIFLSAFLLFQVQLLLGKELLPFFGGAPAVWTACVLVFQLLFLAGYGYSYGLAAWLPIRRQVVVHAALLGLSAAYLAVLAHIRSTPIGFGAGLRQQSGANPVWAIMELLISAIG